jgi:hypothetical protein
MCRRGRSPVPVAVVGAHRPHPVPAAVVATGAGQG